MARQTRVGPPPSTGDFSVDRWLQDVANALNDLPAFSTFSGNPNTSGETADAGVLGFNIASSQSLLWVNTSGTTSGWSTLDYR